ncbi:MAG: Rid family hydrolase [Pseudomonadota bacterium]
MPGKAAVSTGDAPRSTGTHSQAIKANGFVFLTGQTGRNPETGELEQGLEAQTRRVLSNVEAILEAAGCSQADIVRVVLLMERIEDFKAIDDIYRAWLPPREEVPYPVRTASGGMQLPAGAKLLLEVTALEPQ